jgi:hypothetical protein
MMPPKLILAAIDFSHSSKQHTECCCRPSVVPGRGLALGAHRPRYPSAPEGVSIFKEGEFDNELHEKASKQLQKLASTLANKT